MIRSGGSILWLVALSLPALPPIVGCNQASEKSDFDGVGPVFILPKPDAGSPFDPIVLADGQASPWGVAISTGRVFWTNDVGGQIRAVGIDGGEVFSIADSQLKPRGIAADADGVYWVNFGGGTLMRGGLGGGALTTLATGQFQPWAVALDGQMIYWTELAINGNVNRIAKTGTSQMRIASNESSPEGIAARNGVAWWAAYNGNSIRTWKTGSPARSLVTGQSSPAVVAADGANVYWGTQEIFSKTSVVARVPQAGGNPAQLAGGQQYTAGLAVDSTHVYWTNNSDGTVLRVPIAGGEVETLASGQLRPRGIAVGADSVYWVNAGTEGEADGRVMKRLK